MPDTPDHLLPPFDSRSLRDHLGRFCSGITVVAGIGEASVPVGMACQSFTAVSLDPPMVLICPMKTSRTWAALSAAGEFTINVLSEDQEAVCTVFGSRSDHKFAEIDWRPAPVTGAPLIAGAVACYECRLSQAIDAGDHWVVLADVLSLHSADGEPLLFDRGTYRRLEPRRIEPPVTLDALITAHRDEDMWFGAAGFGVGGLGAGGLNRTD